MRVTIVLIILLCSIALATGASAMMVDASSTITTNKEWIIAGSSNVSTITVTAKNGTTPLNQTGVRFVLDPDDKGKGTLLPSETEYINTDNNGEARAYFYVGTQSGNATIRAFINHTPPDSGSYELIFEQQVDHAGPKYIIDAFSQSPVPVNTDVDIAVRFRDTYGNIVDARNTEGGVHSYIVRFDSSGSDGYFITSSGNSFNVTTNTIPNLSPDKVVEATANYHFPTKAGKNYIMVSVLGTSDVFPTSTFFVIEGVGTTPDHIDLDLSDNDVNTPQFNQTYADPKHYFKFIYTVRDVYGNPIPNITLKWSTSADDEGTYKTNYAGNIYLEYSKDTPKIINVNVIATAIVDGKIISVSRDDSVEFIQTEAVDFRLTANPQIIPSRDVPVGEAKKSAIITAKVFDYFGQPKANQQVTFYIDYSTLENSTYLTDLPVLVEPLVRITDANGFASIQFLPGAFPTNYKDIGYNITATGSVKVYAKWGNQSQFIKMVYKNYPFVKVITSVDTDFCLVNETLNYSLSVVGDGFVMNYPVDVVLLEDRAGTMLKEVDGSKKLTEDRMWHVQNASKEFVGKMKDGYDRLALISYGDLALPKANLSDMTNDTNNKMRAQKYLIGKDSPPNNNDDDDFWHLYPGNGNVSYNDFATIDQNLSKDLSTMNNSIMNVTPIDSWTLRNREDLYGPACTIVGLPASQCTGDENAGNSLRYGLYKSITYLRGQKDGYTNIRVIVGLMDDEWTWFGDPTASGSLMTKPFGANAGAGPYWPLPDPDPTHQPFAAPNWNYAGGAGKTNWQNMSNYAKDDNIVLFMVRYSAKTDTETQRTLDILCNSTGGAAYYAATPADLILAFREIADRIHELASVNTTAKLDFKKINVSYENITEGRDGGEVLNYTYIPWLSTHLLKKNLTSTIFNYTQNDTDNWTANHTFNWDIGDIKLNDNWTVTFRMTVLIPGNVNLFGTESEISADNPDDDIPPQKLNLPETWISCFQNWTVPLTSQEVIDVKDTVANYSDTPDILTITWNMTYTKNLNEKGKIIKQELFYQFSQFPDVWTNEWIKIGTLENNATIENVNRTFTYPFMTPAKQGYIRIQVFAYEDIIGGASDRDETMNPTPLLCEKCIRIY